MNGAHAHTCSSRLPHPHRFVYYPHDIDGAESDSLVDYMYQEDEHLHCRDYRSWLGTTSTDLFGRLQLDRFCLASRSVFGSNTHDPYAVVSLLVVYAHAQMARVCLRVTPPKISRENFHECSQIRESFLPRKFPAIQYVRLY